MTRTQTTYINRIALHAGKKGACPAEVGALASVFEKSATELKQKLLKCKQTIQIVTFNVRTLNRIGQLSELTASAVEHKIDVICIQEHRYMHTEDIKYHETGNGWMLLTVSAWKNSVNASVGGVGMLIGPRALKTLNSIERIQPRMMAATFNGNPKATIISCDSPTNVSEENKIVTFYEDLSSLVRSIPKHNLLVIGRDMNAHLGVGELADYVGVNLGLDWPPLARGFQISRYTHTHQTTTSSYPSDNGRYRPLGLDIITLIIVVNNSSFPCNIFKRRIGHLARINWGE